MMLKVGLLSFILFLMACENNPFDTSSKKDEIILASVNGVNLYESSLSDELSRVKTVSDSNVIISSLVELWLVDQLMYEKSISTQKEKSKIEQLAEEYRKSLYVHDFESQLVKDVDPSSFEDQVIIDYYQSYKLQNTLLESIYKIKLLIFTEDVEKLSKFERGWKKDDIVVIDEYKALANEFQLDTSVWITKTDLAALLPSSFPGDKLKGKGFKKSKSEGFVSYLRIIKEKKKGGEIPLVFASNTIKKILVHQRQREIIKRYKEDLYKNAIQNKKIKIFKH